MNIELLEISNFRNLSQKIYFDPAVTFLIGENNLGKSNVLELVHKIIMGNNFVHEDFCVPTSPIECKLSFRLDDVEKGLFDDFFDPSDPDLVTIIAFQANANEELTLTHEFSRRKIPSKYLRLSNYFIHNSLRLPMDDLSFENNRGTGKFLSHLIQRSVKNSDPDKLKLLDERNLDDLIRQVNASIDKIKTLGDYSLNAGFDSDPMNFVARIVSIRDQNGRTIQKQGHGVMFASIAVLGILERILYLSKNGLDRKIVQDENKKQYLPLIFALDEPEVHLHPHLQRDLINYLSKIIQNKDTDFLSLLKDLFGLDGLKGQVIVTTHSPNILTDHFRNIVRLYSSDRTTCIRSGIEIKLEEAEEKQLLRNFPWLKETIFSRGALIVEGDSELGAIQELAKKLNYDFDHLGISVAKADGIGSTKGLAKMLIKFGMPTVTLVDRDGKNTSEFLNMGDVIFTTNQDFEEDLIEHKEHANVETMLSIMKEFEPGIDTRKIQKSRLKKIAVKFAITLEVDVDTSLKDAGDNWNMKKCIMLSWFDLNKSISLGRLIGQKLLAESIPISVKSSIDKLVELVTSGRK